MCLKTTAPPMSSVTFDFSLPCPPPSLRVGVCNPSLLIGLRRSIGFGVADWVDG